MRNLQRRLARVVLVALGGSAAAFAPTAAASDEGMFAADQVSEASYYDFMDLWLYTHAGDNRGFGPEHDPAMDNIALLMASYGLNVTLEPFLYSGTTYYNVVGTKVGTVYPDQEIIVGAHYDSVDNPGADDDASGVALVLEAARIISQYDSEYTMRFIAFDREEQGLIGSYAYVSAHIGDDILGMLQADMVSYDTDTNHARIFGQTASDPIKESVGAAIEEYGDGLTWNDNGPSGGSDHAPFENAGFQACLLIENIFNPYYHSQQDNMDNPNNINWEYAIKMTRSAVGWLVDAAVVHVDVNTLDFTYPDGRPEFIDPAGGTVMRVVVEGVGDVVPQPGTGMLHYDLGAGWESVPMEVVSENVYDAVFPAAECGDEILYYLSAESVGNEIYTDPRHAPDSSYSAVAGYGQDIFWEHTLDADPGWSTEGLWAFGQPTGGGGEYGGPDPTSGYTGPNVYGYNLNGDYENNLPERHLTSDAIDCTGQYQVVLRFYRWLGVEQPTYDHAHVRVSNDGSNWVTIWENPAEIADSSWVLQEFDISAVADDEPTVYLRWTMGTTDVGWRYCGWNVDDIQLLSLDCAGSCPADFDGDGDVDTADLLHLLGAWGTPDGDVDGDGDTDTADLLALLAAWGECP